jgi:excisionase family DNA binding protein
MILLVIKCVCRSPNFPIFSQRTFESKNMTEQMITLKEVAEYLKLAEQTAYRLAADKNLPGFKVGGSWRFKKSDLEAWLEQQKDKE